MQDEKLLKDRDVAAIIGCSRTNVWMMVRDGRLPPPLKLGRMARWRPSAVWAAIQRAEEAA